jgi:hypothetical protein
MIPRFRILTKKVVRTAHSNSGVNGTPQNVQWRITSLGAKTGYRPCKSLGTDCNGPGPCRMALMMAVPTQRLLHYQAGLAVHLKIWSSDCTASTVSS